MKSPYCGENVAEKILCVIKNKLNNEKIDLKKKFYARENY